MAAPTFVAAGTLAEGTAGATVAPNSGHASGDYELLLVETANQACTLATAAGFTEHPGSPITAGTGSLTTDTRLTVFERIWNGSDGSPATNDSGNHDIGVILTFRRSTGTWSALSDVRSATAGVGWSGAAETTEDTTGSFGALASGTDTNDQLIIGVTAHAKPDVAGGTTEMSGLTNADLASITERFDDAAASGNGGWIGAYTGTKATAGTITNTTYTKATASYKAHMTIAIRDSAPAAAITFEASIAGTGALTPDFVRQQTLAVGVAGLGALTTQLDMTRALEVAISGLGAVTADFVRDKLVFEVGVEGLGALAADITVERTVVLEASVVGSSTVTADFVRQVGLAALLSGQGALATELVRQIGFETAIAGLGAVVPTQLAVQVGMESIVQGIGQVVADFVRTPLALEAAIAGNGLVVVDITVTTPGGEVLIVRTLLGVGL